jgi:hypothetical protein
LIKTFGEHRDELKSKVSVPRPSVSGPNIDLPPTRDGADRHGQQLLGGGNRNCTRLKWRHERYRVLP